MPSGRLCSSSGLNGATLAKKTLSERRTCGRAAIAAQTAGNSPGIVTNKASEMPRLVPQMAKIITYSITSTTTHLGNNGEWS